MAAAAPVPQRTFTIARQSGWTWWPQEVICNGQPILFIDCPRQLFGKPDITFRTPQNVGVPVAACKLRSFSSDVQFIVGNPANVPKEQWNVVDSGSIGQRQWSYNIGRRCFIWKRTHRAELGAHAFGSSDLKLVDSSNDQIVIAVYIRNRSGFSERKLCGQLNWFMILSQEEELAALASVVAVEERLRQNRNSSNSAAAGSAGGGA